jgi:hypothetical protein
MKMWAPPNNAQAKGEPRTLRGVTAALALACSLLLVGCGHGDAALAQWCKTSDPALVAQMTPADKARAEKVLKDLLGGADMNTANSELAQLCR